MSSLPTRTIQKIENLRDLPCSADAVRVVSGPEKLGPSGETWAGMGGGGSIEGAADADEVLPTSVVIKGALGALGTTP